MEINGDLTIPQVEGFPEEQVIYALTEITKGTDPTTLQILLYKKFGLYDNQAFDLIEKIKQSTGLAPTVYVANNADDFVQMMVQKGYDREEAELAVNERIQIENDEVDNNKAKDFFIGLLIMTVGLLITFSGVGVIAYGAIIYGALRLIRGIF